MFLFNADRYDFHIYDLSGDFVLHYDLNMNFSYRAYMQFVEKVKVRVS